MIVCILTLTVRNVLAPPFVMMMDDDYVPKYAPSYQKSNKETYQFANIFQVTNTYLDCHQYVDQLLFSKWRG